MKTDSQNKLTGFIIAVILMFLFFFYINSPIFAQNSNETGSSGSLLAKAEYTVPLGNLPSEFRLYQNYQNAETIRFDVPEVSQVKITIFDLRGTIIKGFLYDNIQPGTHHIDITDLQNGEYTYSMSSGSYNKSFSMSVSK